MSGTLEINKLSNFSSIKLSRAKRGANELKGWLLAVTWNKSLIRFVGVSQAKYGGII